MNAGEMLHDLQRLLKDRAVALAETPNGRAAVVDAEIIGQHGLSWFEGDPEAGSERLSDFIAEARDLIDKVQPLVDDADKLGAAWVKGICDIEAGYDDYKGKGKTILERLDQKELVRHAMNGGTQWGLANNIRKQVDEIHKQDSNENARYAENLLKTASERFKAKS